MKVGDLVRCMWQPEVSRVEDGHCVPMHLPLKGEIGVIEKQPNPGIFFVFFPRFGYRHPLCSDSLEIINENR